MAFPTDARAISLYPGTGIKTPSRTGYKEYQKQPGRKTRSGASVHQDTPASVSSLVNGSNTSTPQGSRSVTRNSGTCLTEVDVERENETPTSYRSGRNTTVSFSDIDVKQVDDACSFWSGRNSDSDYFPEVDFKRKENLSSCWSGRGRIVTQHPSSWSDDDVLAGTCIRHLVLVCLCSIFA